MTKPRPNGRHPQVTRLLNHAQANAVKDLEEELGKKLEATPANLHLLAGAIKNNLETQVGAGMWANLNIDDPDQFENVGVTATLGNQLLGEAPIMIAYNFENTPLAWVVMEYAAPPKGRA